MTIVSTPIKVSTDPKIHTHTPSHTEDTALGTYGEKTPMAWRMGFNSQTNLSLKHHLRVRINFFQFNCTLFSIPPAEADGPELTAL